MEHSSLRTGLGWAVRLITFSGWLGVNQCRLIVPAHVDVFSLKCLYLLVNRDDDSLKVN